MPERRRRRAGRPLKCIALRQANCKEFASLFFVNIQIIM